MTEQNERLRELAAEVAAAYFSNSHVNPADIPTIIGQIANSLTGVGAEAAQPEAAAEEQPKKLTSAQIRKSITPDALISFEDGKPYKSLRRHLTTRGMSSKEYIAKWGLPKDYPMVSPNYSAARSEMAKKIGLGQKGRAAAASRKGKGRKPVAA